MHPIGLLPLVEPGPQGNLGSWRWNVFTQRLKQRLKFLQSQVTIANLSNEISTFVGEVLHTRREDFPLLRDVFKLVARLLDLGLEFGEPLIFAWNRLDEPYGSDCRRFMSRSLFVVLLGLLIGFQVGGLLGSLLAVPVIASIRDVAVYVWRKLIDVDPWPDDDMDEAAREP